MLKNIQRDSSVLVSYNPPPKSPCRNPNSDLDFNDVFGGPPRRASLQNVRHSFGEEPSGDDPETAPLRTRWSGLYEKPVFGEHEGAAKNRGGRGHNGDFFDDIFGGSESLSSSPRRHVTGSPAGSRVLSPARPLPPRSDPIGSSSSSLPAPFSLPSKLMKPTTDLPTFGSSPRSSLLKAKEVASNGGMISNYSFSPLSRSSSKPDLVVMEEFKDNIRSQGSLSRQFSINSRDDLSSMDKEQGEEQYREGTSEDKSKGGNRGHSYGHFHFSIYKWASQGAPPISMPLRSANSSRSKDKLVFSSPASEASAELETQFKPELKPLRSMLLDSDSEQGTLEGDSEKDLLRESKVKSSSSKKKASSEAFDVSQGKVEVQKGDSRLQEIHERSNKTKGKKVNAFVKIFNQEVKKPDVMKGVKTQKKPEKKKESRDSRTPDDDGTSKTTRSNEEEINVVPDKNSKGIHLKEASYNVQVDEYQKQTDEKIPVVERSYSYRSSETEHISAASVPDASEEASVGDPDEPFQVRELPDQMEEDEPIPTTDSNSEHLQVNDAKIRKWCQGKDGNIRSLLSTLQYVLWPGSGWKPVPLMDIIEGNAVKRSYQRALLCLHPDKLQQKGATPEQKYIAEKVFDILQEAWIHFNSLGSIV
ncbi:unnamed protein product [Linum trigynum]|uniref:J domain-containing protein required for chloroplast accumulation response 1 n=1 Tax=Linum trigynum TaxID=586398 RepID=A0AAV2GLH3_9ROSI